MNCNNFDNPFPFDLAPPSGQSIPDTLNYDHIPAAWLSPRWLNSWETCFVLSIHVFYLHHVGILYVTVHHGGLLMIHVYCMWHRTPDWPYQGNESMLFHILLWFAILLTYHCRSVFPVSGFADKPNSHYTSARATIMLTHVHAHLRAYVKIQFNTIGSLKKQTEAWM